MRICAESICSCSWNHKHTEQSAHPLSLNHTRSPTEEDPAKKKIIAAPKKAPETAAGADGTAPAAPQLKGAGPSKKAEPKAASAKATAAGGGAPSNTTKAAAGGGTKATAAGGGTKATAAGGGAKATAAGGGNKATAADGGSKAGDGGAKEAKGDKRPTAPSAYSLFSNKKRVQLKGVCNWLGGGHLCVQLKSGCCVL